ncbi:hypothetical protein N7467_000765 [Penicillium canescens]|nr:hypothetical protein N7467_000765 [Penicillium canescens]
MGEKSRPELGKQYYAAVEYDEWRYCRINRREDLSTARGLLSSTTNRLTLRYRRDFSTRHPEHSVEAAGRRVSLINSIIVTLRKAGPRDYRLPKAYRLVALLNTLGKVLEAIINLLRLELPRPLKSIRCYLILTLVGNNPKASMLLLDIASAYDNVSHERLLYNM